MHLHRYGWDDPNERCGIIVRAPWGTHFIELPNRHPQPEHRFSIRAGDIKTALKRYPDIELLGFFHTHPGDKSMERPSTRDLHIAAQMRDYLHAMYHPWTRQLVWYDHTGVVGQDYVKPTIRAGRLVV